MTLTNIHATDRPTSRDASHLKNTSRRSSSSEMCYLLPEDCDGGVVEAAEPRNLPPLVSNQPHLQNIIIINVILGK